VNIRHIAASVLAGVAVAAIAAAPIAAAANPSTVTDGGRTTTTDRQGHSAIVVKPPTVSSPNVYGPFSSPLPIIIFD